MNPAARNFSRMTPRQLDALTRGIEELPRPWEGGTIGRYPTPSTRGMRHFFAIRNDAGKTILRTVRVRKAVTA